MEKFTKIIILFTSLFLMGQSNIYATEKDYIEEGNLFLNKIENNENTVLNSSYIKKALYNFYVASKATPPSTDALVGLGRVYTQMDKYDDAKNALFEAYSIDKYNAEANFYFGEFWFKYNEFETALKYYKNAYELGFKNTQKVLDMIIKCYNKLGDIQSIEEIQR